MPNKSSLWGLLAWLMASVVNAHPFTYQGYLREGGSLANGNYDLRFRIAFWLGMSRSIRAKNLSRPKPKRGDARQRTSKPACWEFVSASTKRWRLHFPFVQLMNRFPMNRHDDLYIPRINVRTVSAFDISKVRGAALSNKLATALALGWMLGTTGPLHAQSLTWLGTLGGDRSIANGVSANGGVVVGYAHNAQNKPRAFRWTSGGGMVNLGTLYGGTYSVATDVSANGNLIVGRADELTARGSRPERGFWTTSGGLRSMSTFPSGYTSSALGVSPDGGWIAGWADFYDHPQRAFAVPPGSLNDQQELGTLGGERSEARGVSNNGIIIVGWSENHLGEIWAFYVRRSPNSGMRELNMLAACCGQANGVSDNGNVIVGRSHSAQTERWHACLWWWSGSAYDPRDLGTLGGQESEANACTNSQTAVGWSHNAAGQRRAFRWTPAGGMEDLTMIYQNLLSSGSYLEVARDITPDGRYIVGWGYNAATGRTEAFLLDTQCVAHNGDVDNNGCVNDTDLLAVLFNFGQSGQNLGQVDVNCDSVVDDADLLVVLFNFGSGC